MIRITYSKNSKKVLDSYDKKTSLRIVKAIENIPLGDIKRLEGNNVPLLYRLRIGKHRVIYFYPDNYNIRILKIDTRGDVYK
ncbi:type II toxin-antitoxin system RelE/ParE family toxin [Proteiniborus sp.]|uniref:type II toxin-antitoxin system RelE family toxin n=1 Tax=Proteiniborus sp. TaxID=2079015 RepID=UPI00331B115D